MPTVPHSELPVPKSWDEFEDIVADLYKHAWDDAQAQRHGRTGQAQQGVDICGRPVHLQGRYAGIQCKRYEPGTLTLEAIKAEVAKAEQFKPPLAEYTIATTDRRDAKLQEAVRLITQEREAAGKFAVHLVFWEDLCSLLSHPGCDDILRKHYGDWLQRFACPAAGYVPPPPRDPDRDPLPEPGPLPPGSRLPFHRNALFTGRVEPLRALARTLLPPQQMANRKSPASSFRLPASNLQPPTSIPDHPGDLWDGRGGQDATGGRVRLPVRALFPRRALARRSAARNHLGGARAAFERALAIDEAVYGSQHPQVAIFVNNLGRVLQDLGDLEGARAAYERALRIVEQFLPPDHSHTRTVRSNLEGLRHST